ncbi:MAG: transposase family protein [Alphaproteobacteria bacterium]
MVDPRSYHDKEYQLWQILLVTILSILANRKTYHDIRKFLEVHYQKLNEIFKLNWRQLPDESAIRKIIVMVNHEEIERTFRIRKIPEQQGYFLLLHP